MRDSGWSSDSFQSVFSLKVLPQDMTGLGVKRSGLWAACGAGSSPQGLPASAHSARGAALTASCRAAAARAGTAGRRCPRAPRPRAPGARRPGSRSPRSWRPWRARRRTGTGHRWPVGTGRRLGWLACTQCRARTETGPGRLGSPRWAGRWLVGRCSGESACGAKQRGSGSGNRAGKPSWLWAGVEDLRELRDAVSPLLSLTRKMGAVTIMVFPEHTRCAHDLHSTFPSTPQSSRLPSSSPHSDASSVSASQASPFRPTSHCGGKPCRSQMGKLRLRKAVSAGA